MHFHFSNKNQLKELINNEDKWLYSWKGDEDLNDSNYKTLGEINQINLFVGSNNSGKSRFIRAIVKSEMGSFEISFSIDRLEKQLLNINSVFPVFNKRIHYTYRNTLAKIQSLVNSRHPNELYKNKEKIVSKLNLLLEIKDEYASDESTYSKIIFEYIDLVEAALLNSKFINENLPNRKVYIPILRSVQENDYLKDGYFKQTIKDNYGIEKNVFTGIELFKEVLSLKTSNSLDRKKVKKFEEFLSKHFFNSKEVEITSNSITKKLLFSVDDVENHIYDIGDGIQSLIILLFPIFTAEKNDWFFIEEPETNIHPGLQRIFIQTLLNDEYLKEKNLKYFFTTHSNHFLDITLLNDEISIFQFEKKDKRSFKIKTNVKPSKDVLDVLGVNTSSVFLANTSIWVEGPTDRKYLSKILKLYSEDKAQLLKEDIDYSFFEYGGNLIQHYLFHNEIDFNEEIVREKINSFALSNKIYLLADNDNVDKRSAKGKRRKLLEENTKNNSNFLYQNTELKEIENLLPKVIIKDFLNSLIKDLEDFESINIIGFDKSDYDKIGLGEFYESLLIKNGISKKQHKSFKAESGTLKNDYKIMLADFVINSEYKYEDFIEDNDILKQIIEDLYEFIKS